ncbi:MAG: NnrT protein, partial [Pseudomonadota bacterium]|nr:NnrT protein [Pseudomonadota bacterium]
FGAGAMGVNLFFASLIGSWMGLPVLTPWQSAAGGLVIGLPATYAFACHIVRLMEKAES